MAETVGKLAEWWESWRWERWRRWWESTIAKQPVASVAKAVRIRTFVATRVTAAAPAVVAGRSEYGWVDPPATSFQGDTMAAAAVAATAETAAMAEQEAAAGAAVTQAEMAGRHTLWPRPGL